MIEEQNGLNQFELHEQGFVAAHYAIDACPYWRGGSGRRGGERMSGGSLKSLFSEGLLRNQKQVGRAKQPEKKDGDTYEGRRWRLTLRVRAAAELPIRAPLACLRHFADTVGEFSIEIY